jgi:xanthine dehydrogenase accessory factor
MTDLEPILTLWQELHGNGVEYVLATIVRVEGSGYRKPGAMMIVAADGRKCGTISGGCLEAEVARRAFWYTKDGAVVRAYSTSADDGDVPYGMGCGGVVHLLLERSVSALPFLEQLNQAYRERQGLTVATVLSGGAIGQRSYWPGDSAGENELARTAASSYRDQRSFSDEIRWRDGSLVAVRAEFRAARPGLFVFGAGDDAMPLVRQARNLGWYVVLADGRSHLATKVRFPEAHEVHVLPARGTFPFQLLSTDAAAVMTHSLEQDTYFLSSLLPRHLSYLGVLGPIRRTTDMLDAVALSIEGSRAEQLAEREAWKHRVHAPMGLDLGGDTPADIALAVVAEIQQTLRGASGLALRTRPKRSLSYASSTTSLSAD